MPNTIESKAVGYQDGWLGVPRRVGVREYDYPFKHLGDLDTFILTETWKVADGSYRPAATGAPHPLWHTAYLLRETKPTPTGLGSVKWQKIYAKIPPDQVDYDSVEFTRLVMDDINWGSAAWAVSIDGGRTAHVFTTRKTATAGTIVLGNENMTRNLATGNGPGALPAGVAITVTGDNSSQSFTTSDPATTIQDACANACAGVTTYAAGFPVVIDKFGIVIRNVVGTNLTGYSIKSVTVGVNTVKLNGSLAPGDSLTITAPSDAGTDAGTIVNVPDPDPSKRTINCTGHGFSAGEKVPLWMGDRVVARTYCMTVPDVDHFTVPLDDVSGKDFSCSHAQRAGAGVRYVCGSKLCAVRVTQKFYWPGVTAGIATGEDIPKPAVKTRDPITYLGEIISASTYSVDGATKREDWPEAPSPLKRVVITEIQMADAKDTASASA